jgi:hypothetical protein
LKDVIGIDPSLFENVAQKNRSRYQFTPRSRVVIVPDTHFRVGENGMSEKSSFDNRVSEVESEMGVILEAEIHIKQSTIDDTLSALESKRAVRNMLAILQRLSTVSTHDYTMHQVGVAGLYSDTVRIAYKTLNIPPLKKRNSVDPGNSTIDVVAFEQLAASFHKTILFRIFEQYPTLKENILKEARRFIDMTYRLPPPLREKWLEKLKYILYSIIDPNSEEGRALRSHCKKDPGFKGIEPGAWAEVVHRKWFELDEKFVAHMMREMQPANSLGIKPNVYGPIPKRRISAENLFDCLYLKGETQNLGFKGEMDSEVAKKIFEKSEEVGGTEEQKGQNS